MHPAGQKWPNGLGRYDRHGNVWEWCWDGDDADDDQGSPVDDPRGVEGASNRVNRGASRSHDPPDCRSATRLRFAPVSRGSDLLWPGSSSADLVDSLVD
jgi:formylglycine-generating enzyme required for sulfatase activity